MPFVRRATVLIGSREVASGRSAHALASLHPFVSFAVFARHAFQDRGLRDTDQDERALDRASRASV